ncbi:unnamed protein product [Effrenium voratum]|uniref:Uncharacterized protein n=1 Tax=Effrenium voratum TaxID=2562239 RepID=A0AA36IPK5_9DINO|nr:unnamed protein product [Effrenium voratum]
MPGKDVSAESEARYAALQQTRLEADGKARATQRLAMLAVVVALAAVLAVGGLLWFRPSAKPEGPSFPPDMEEIHPGWVSATVPVIVREEASKESKQLGILEANTRLYVQEVRGVRARIVEPMEGWVSCVSGNVQVLTVHEVDEELREVRQKLLAHQKTQRDLLAALEKAHQKGHMDPAITKEVKDVLKDETSAVNAMGV